ncbi:FAD-binding and (Fe-S)-binding domain-containing protein [Galbibacter mesophilus]|uniref:FAD-binding and (Fe-S)-binding domain-containing protein n=1 Tax=Galbibacter mesophilus TaxID=379069 RepID=UPI00191D2355|nr:FAD-binding and (Fe-S)-binding domain-containing protein [Galbibacter mesophilus]MCM5663340.1 FAD-binding protein [Galbibacter mesophilus]
MSKNSLDTLAEKLSGDLFFDNLHRTIYATDASVYRELPLAVAYPKNTEDIKKIIAYCNENKASLIPRTAGTSLAGQCVGDGIVVDVSKNFTKIVSLDKEDKTVTVEPGVIRDELNLYLEEHGVFFGPNTSTSNRCMIGGMVGNNSSGTTSIKYGVTRDKVLEIEGILSDGSEVVFKEISSEEFQQKLKLDNLEGEIYRNIYKELKAEGIKEQVIQNFPKPEIHRRNTGYAIDELLKLTPFTENEGRFNMCKLLSGSEGTLVFKTKIKLQLDELMPAHAVMIAAHYKSVSDCCASVHPVMQHDLYSCEMMDKVILDCTKNNKSQLPNRFFIEGDPEAILMLELRDENKEALELKKQALIRTLDDSGLSYANPALYGTEINQAAELRKAGLGLLGNIVGDKKAVACIEDTAVSIDDLSNYITEFSAIMESYQQKAVYYAHAGAGELHLRPILDLKKSEDVALFRQITTDVAHLVKKYGGSMSGEHGDGRVRAEFVEMMIGSENYNMLKRIKHTFDPNNIFNPGKIVDSAPMDTSLRYKPNRQEPEIETLLDFSDSLGIVRAAEKCNGSGDCRKTHLSSGAMCPSYHATKNEKDTTRARANALREYLTVSEKKNKFNNEELKQVFDLCISCKACSSECPSNVDVATLKTEFLYQYYKDNPPSLRDKAFAYNTELNKWASKFSFVANSSFSGKIIKNILGIAPERHLPKIESFNFNKEIQTIKNKKVTDKKVLLYIDEFTQYLDTTVGKDAIELLTALGYDVSLFYGESGRTFISKGFLGQAQKLANKNTEKLKDLVNSDFPILGIEPSAILSFRDEYLRMVNDKESVKKLALNSFLVEEFLSEEIKKGNISTEMFSEESKTIKYHAHCHQKSQSNTKVTFDILNLPKNFSVTMINAGCCGMAGSFGYEKEHYATSMAIGELRLFPAVRKAPSDTIIVANGTSCRHQIKDGTARDAAHPITLLNSVVKK